MCVAQARQGDSIILHGTISVSTNLDMLKKPKACKDKMQNKALRKRDKRVTTLKE
jgi:lipoate-protein ligase A